jgi:hypothetical protein
LDFREIQHGRYFPKSCRDFDKIQACPTATQNFMKIRQTVSPLIQGPGQMDGRMDIAST